MNGCHDDTIDISDAELDVTLQKACVGAGVGLGTGIELGRAALTIRRAGIDAASVFASAMNKYSTGDPAEGSGFVSAISDGPAVCDRFITEVEPALGIPVDCPLIVVALLAARGYCGRMTMAGCDGEALFRHHALTLKNAASSAALVPNRIELRHEAPGKPVTLECGRSGVRAVDTASWSEICALADRCLVSGSEESRLNDAGAGLVDED